MATRSRNPARLGIFALVLALLVITIGLNAQVIKDRFSGSGYSAAFAEAGGLHAGDKVRISGVRVGRVSSVAIDGDHVKVSFSTERRIFDQTRAAIKTDTLLGSKFLALEIEGDGPLSAGAEIPISRTESPYDITEALSDLTDTAGAIDSQQLSASLDTLSAAFDGAPEEVRRVLDGTRRLATTISSRDDDLSALLESAEGVSGILAQRNADVISIVANGNALLGELQRRRDATGELLRGLQDVSDQFSGFVEDNREDFKPALLKLRRAIKVINANVDNIADTLDSFSKFLRSILEGIGSGPFFSAYIAGLSPVSLAPVLGDLLTSGEPLGEAP